MRAWIQMRCEPLGVRMGPQMLPTLLSGAKHASLNSSHILPLAKKPSAPPRAPLGHCECSWLG